MSISPRASSTELAARDAVGKIEKAIIMAKRAVKSRFFMTFLQKWAGGRHELFAQGIPPSMIFRDNKSGMQQHTAFVHLEWWSHFTWMLYSVR